MKIGAVHREKMMNRFGIGLFCVALLAGAAAQAAPIATFECQERLGVDWPRTLVTYPVAFKPGEYSTNQLRLVDINGSEQPFQLSRVERDAKSSVMTARISFFASLPAQVRSNAVLQSSRYRYELLAEKPLTPANTSLRAAPEGESLVLVNGMVAVRLPKLGEAKLDKPLTEATGPIQGVRLVDGRWTARSTFFAADTNSQPRVIGITCEITEQGPLFVEARVRYAFAGSEKYELTARVLEGDPAVRIDEQYDLGGPGDLWKYRLMVPLAGGGWKPDVAYALANEGRLKGDAPAYAAKLMELGISNNVGMSVAMQFDQPYTKVFDVAARYPWHPNAQLFGLVNTTEMTTNAAQQRRLPFLGVAPMHPGNWRGSIAELDAMLFSHQENANVQLNWPLVVPPHPRTLLHTGEYDSAVPLSLGRRQWALIGGTFQTTAELRAFRSYEGFVNLDDYKEWVLDWPVDPKTTYPRLVFSKADAERLKPTIDTLAGAAQLKTFLYFNDTDTRRQELWGQLTYLSEWSGPAGMLRNILDRGGMPWQSHFRYAQMAGWAGNADELLASEKLLPDQRARLRADLAGLCSLLAEPDVNPRGSMTHLGNPNMPINRFCALPWTAALIPDHPQAKTWLDLSAQYARYKLAMNTAPGGAWSELMSYFNASAPHLMQSAAVLAQAGRLDKSTAELVTLPAQFPLRLIAPRDPRFGARIVPGWGHEGIDGMFHFLVAAVVARPVDPDLATALIWAWDQCGRPMSGHHDAGFSPRAQVYDGLLPKPKPGYVPPQLKSTWLPGFGATVRAHAGDPSETYLSLRNGYLASHSDANQGDFVLYSKGAPLVTESLFGYAISQGGPFDTELDKKFGWHARPRFGTQQNNGGWPGGGTRGGVPAHAFTDSIDYLRAPGDYPSTALGAGGSNRWTRQIAFLKGKAAGGPNYFVFRDSFDPVDGNPASMESKWWYLRTLGPKTNLQVSANELIRTSVFGGVTLTAHFLQPASVTVESRDATQQGPLYFGNAETWQRAGSPVKAGSGGNVTVEETMTVSAVGPLAPDQDVLVVLYPRSKDEAAPTYESLGDGAAKVVTGESTDYVFVDRKPMKFAGKDVSFEGIAGAVRVYPKETHLIISEGPGTISYKGATLRSVEPALKVVKAGQKANFDLPARPSKLKNTALPPGCAITGDGVCELTIDNDRITGRSESRGAFLFVPMPAGMTVLPMLVIDGQTYAPGTTGDGLIIPLLEGEHRFEVRALEQPPIFHNWQAW